MNDQNFLQKARTVAYAKGGKLTLKNFSSEFKGASKDTIKKSLAAVRSDTNKISSHNEEMSLLEPLFILLKQLNPEFEYIIERNEETLEFTYAACTMLGAKNFYKKMLGVIGIDGAHIKIHKVIAFYFKIIMNQS